MFNVRAKFHQAKCSGSLVIVLTTFDNGENNTAVASAGSKNITNGLHTHKH